MLFRVTVLFTLLYRLTPIVTCNIARRYLVYSEADWSEIWHGGGAIFHPNRCNDKGVGPKNEIFTQI